MQRNPQKTARNSRCFRKAFYRAVRRVFHASIRRRVTSPNGSGKECDGKKRASSTSLLSGTGCALIIAANKCAVCGDPESVSSRVPNSSIAAIVMPSSSRTSRRAHLAASSPGFNPPPGNAQAFGPYECRSSRTLPHRLVKITLTPSIRVPR